MDIDSPIQSRFNRSRKVRITSMSSPSPSLCSLLTTCLPLSLSTLFNFLVSLIFEPPTVVAADSLIKRDILRVPDPFAIVSVDGEQIHTTSVIKRTLNPYWNE